ncbi:MAG: hypothetical protein Kow0068_22960 [Marinilabiliales bacterium]
MLGFSPNNPEIYNRAFIHCSANIKNSDNFSINNERLEFLGDTVLSTVISEYIYINYPDENEGFLSKTRSKLVSRENLSEIADKLKLQKYFISKIDQEDVIYNLLGNVLEALIGAIMIDKGYKFCRYFIYNKIINPYIDFDKIINTDTNFKGKLIEWAQKNNVDISFKTTELEHNDNHHLFECKVILNKNYPAGSGNGKTKKEAQQNASKNTLQKINKKQINI